MVLRLAPRPPLLHLGSWAPDERACANFAAELFGKLPRRNLPPDEAIALGAAVQAALKQGESSVDDLVVTDIAPFTLGIATSVANNDRFLRGIFSSSSAALA